MFIGSPAPTLAWVEGGRTIPPTSKSEGDHRSSATYRYESRKYFKWSML